jgi:hypothetical protein
MKPIAVAALCAAGLLAAPLAAKAAEYLLVDANTGEPVAVVAGPTMPVAMPDIFAEQDAIMAHMVREMRAMEAAFASGPAFAAPAGGLTPAALAGMTPGSTIVTTSFSDGSQSCSRTVVYEQNGRGAPIAHVSQTGDACSALPAISGATPVPAALPDEMAPPERVVPAANPDSPKLIRVDYRHPVTQPAPKRG